MSGTTVILQRRKRFMMRGIHLMGFLKNRTGARPQTIKGAFRGKNENARSYVTDRRWRHCVC